MITLTLIVIFSIPVFIYIQRAKFGRIPHGERLEKIKRSPHYRKGSFQNIHYTPNLTEGVRLFDVFKEFFFTKKIRVKPVGIIPSMKTPLLDLDPAKDVLIWFGHSSYFIQIDGKRILVDPVLSGAASPISSTTRAFKGTDQYTADDIPMIDFLFISHDHWDHLDYETILKLKPKIKKVICGLGTGEHLERWGYDKNIILERDWNEAVTLEDGFSVHTVPARHFSGRGFRRNKSLWISFVLTTPTAKLLIGGDSGYDTHFAEIGKNFGPFDLVILENGQYDKSWKYIHMMPSEVLEAAKELKAKALFPVHSAKFALANHAWDAPLKNITELNKEARVRLLTPMIGQPINLKDDAQTFSKWWEGVE